MSLNAQPAAAAARRRRSNRLAVAAAAVLSSIVAVAGAVRIASAQAVAEPAVDRAGSRAAQGMRHAESETPLGLFEGDHATGDWGGVRSALARKGIDFDAVLISDLSQNFHGGLDTESRAFRHLFEASLTFESKPLFDYDGGKLFLDLQSEGGRNGTDRLVGDFQGFSNIDADGFTALFELWYEQVLFDGKMRVKVGKVDAAGEFAFVDHGADFINSSPGADPALLGYPTYPDPATSVNVFVYPAKGLYLGGGVYDGATQDGKPTGTRGPATFFGPPADLFLIGEIGFGWDGGPSRRAGRVGVGASHHTGTFDVLDGSGRTERGATGAYLVFDQFLYRENTTDDTDVQGIAGFVQLGFGEEDVAAADAHVGVGVTWAGGIEGRDHDVVGLMLSYVHFSDVARAAGTFTEDYELAVEVFYNIGITPWLSIKPDLQYIVNPGGAGLRDAIVATVRFEIAL
jgi:porin